MEPIDEERSGRSWLCCLAPAKKSSSNGAAAVPSATSSRPTIGKRSNTVFISARDSLGVEELAALKEFEEAVKADLGGQDESIYFDALDASENNDEVIPYAPAKVADPRLRQSLTMDDPTSLLKVMKELKEPRVQVDGSGYPGNLTQAELAACQQFRAELKQRDKIWQEVVRVYDPVETEPYALCRFLRARQFDVVKVLDMISETLEIWREARKHDYFPSEYRNCSS
jgi:CRAL/TRIO, N-terminal domain